MRHISQCSMDELKPYDFHDDVSRDIKCSNPFRKWRLALVTYSVAEEGSHLVERFPPLDGPIEGYFIYEIELKDF